MPGADEKVILKVKLEMEGVSKEFQALTKEVHKLSVLLKRLNTDSIAGFKGQRTAARDLQRTFTDNERQAEIKRKKDQTNRTEDTKYQDKQKNWRRDEKEHLGKVESATTRFLRGLGIGSGANRWFQRPEGGYAQRAGQLIGSAPRVMANTAMSIGSGLLGFMLGGIQGGYNTYLQVGQARGPLAGMGMAGRGSHAQLLAARRMAGGVGGVNLGFAPSVTYQHARAVGQATGDINSVYRAQQFALAAGGMDVGEAAGMMGALRSGGLQFGLGRQFGGKKGSQEWRNDQAQDLAIRNRSARELERLIASGMATGIEKTRLNQYMQNISTAVGVAGERTTGNVDLRNITTGFGLLARMGINDPRRAMARAQQIDQAIMAPGGGEAGQAMVMGAFGYGRPGGTTSWYDALKRQQQGFMGTGGAKNLMDIAKFNIQQYAPEARQGMAGSDPRLAFANYAGNLMGMGNLDFMEKLNEMILKGEDDTTIQKQIEKELQKQEPLEKRALKATEEGFSDVVTRLAGIEARNAGIGASTARLVEWVQDQQYNLLRKLVDYIPDIIKFLKEIAIYIKALFEGFKNAKTFWNIPEAVREAYQKMVVPFERENAANLRRMAAEKIEKWRTQTPKNAAEMVKQQQDINEFKRKLEGISEQGTKGVVGSEAAAASLLLQKYQKGFLSSTISPEEAERKTDRLAKLAVQSFGLHRTKKGKPVTLGDIPTDDPAVQEALQAYRETPEGEDAMALSRVVSEMGKAYTARQGTGGRGRRRRQATPKVRVAPGGGKQVVDLLKKQGVLSTIGREGASAFATEESRFVPRLPKLLGQKSSGTDVLAPVLEGND